METNMEEIAKYINNLSFKKKVMGGIDEAEALLAIKQVSQMYEEVFKSTEQLLEDAKSKEAQQEMRVQELEYQISRFEQAGPQVEGSGDQKYFATMLQARKEADEIKRKAFLEAEDMKKQYASYLDHIKEYESGALVKVRESKKMLTDVEQIMTSDQAKETYKSQSGSAQGYPGSQNGTVQGSTNPQSRPAQRSTGFQSEPAQGSTTSSQSAPAQVYPGSQGGPAQEFTGSQSGTTQGYRGPQNGIAQGYSGFPGETRQGYPGSQNVDSSRYGTSQGNAGGAAQNPSDSMARNRRNPMTAAGQMTDAMRDHSRAFQDTANRLQNTARETAGQARNGAVQRADQIQDTAQNAWNRMSHVAKNGVEDAQNVVQNTSAYAQSAVGNAAGQIKNSTQNTWDRTKSTVYNAAEQVQNPIRNTAERIQNTAGNAAEHVQETVQDSWSRNQILEQSSLSLDSLDEAITKLDQPLAPDTSPAASQSGGFTQNAEAKSRQGRDILSKSSNTYEAADQKPYDTNAGKSYESPVSKNYGAVSGNAYEAPTGTSYDSFAGKTSGEKISDTQIEKLAETLQQASQSKQGEAPMPEFQNPDLQKAFSMLYTALANNPSQNQNIVQFEKNETQQTEQSDNQSHVN